MIAVTTGPSGLDMGRQHMMRGRLHPWASKCVTLAPMIGASVTHFEAQGCRRPRIICWRPMSSPLGPVVTAIMPLKTYDPRYLDTAMSSLLAQTCPDWRLLAVAEPDEIGRVEADLRP